jgi:hypothetical protein
MVGKFGEVMIRGLVSIILIPVFFYMISTVVNGADVLAMLTTQRPLVGFIVVVLLPISYFLIGILWTLAPLFRKDKPVNPYIGRG